MAGTATTIARAIGAGAVPGQTDEQGSVVAPVGGPPVLRVGHQRLKVCLQGAVIQGGESRRVIECVTERIGGRVMLMQDPEVDLIGPPVAVVRVAGWCDRTGVATEGAFQI